MSATEWKCNDCRVRVTFAPDASCPADSAGVHPKPNHWVADEDGWHCLRCQREAILKQPTVEGAGTPAQQRRGALVRFELRREPGASNVEVARWVKCTSAQVAEIRNDPGATRLVRPGAPANS
jgi:hypothetical protein